MVWRRRAAVLAGVTALAAGLAVPAALAAPTAGEDPGDVLAAQKVAVPTLPGATATRIEYRSTDTDDRPDVVSGIVLTPAGASPGLSKVVGFAAGTQGLADRCAPSSQLQAGTEYEAQAIGALLARGYAVAVTDYEGLGTPGEHPYVNRTSQAHAVLDVVRAATRAGAGVDDDAQVALYGYSQGGGAAAAAAELAGDYAPELDVVGTYAGAVPADLAATARMLDGSPYAALLGYAVSGFDVAYPDLGIPSILNERGRTVLDELRHQCLTDSVPRYAGLRTSDLTVDGRPVTAYLQEEPFRSRVAEQLIGTRPPDAPVLVVHSVADDIVPFDQARTMAQRWCSEGADVEFRPAATPTHVGAVPEGQVRALAFLDSRFAGRDTRPTCT